ncbi:basic salivary proline-rich protein 1 [Capsicum chacoense]
MASGSSCRPINSSTSKGFDFGSDDILCSYEDNYPHHDGASNGTHSDHAPVNNSAKEFHKSRMTRSSMFPTSTYSPPEESSFNQDMICTVEKTMKKHADNLMRFLEGISSRLSQLELYCYNLDKSIGEMRSDLVRDHGEADLKLKALEKHVQEVHRSVQILRDKQELADTQKELSKLQFTQKEPTSASNSQQNDDRTAQPVSDSNKADNSTDVHGQQLALALPHQVAPRAPLTNRPIEQPQQPPPLPIPSQSLTQSQGYYLPPVQMSNPPAPTHLSQGQYLSSDPQYRTSQMQDLSRVPPQPAAPQGNQTPQIQSMPQYLQQWAQQVPQQVQASQQVQQHQLPTVQLQARPSSPAVYPSYPPSQPNPSPEQVPNSMPIQVSFSAIPQSVVSRPEAVSYGFDRSGIPLQSQPPTQHLKPSFGAPGDGYAASGPHPSLSAGNAYLMYDSEGTRGHPQQPQNFPQSGYPPSSFPPQNAQSAPSPNLMVRPPQSMHTHLYNELIEKMASMGYRGDHVVNVIQRLEESGQTVDFNTVLDRLNGHSSGGPQRGWSG